MQKSSVIDNGLDDIRQWLPVDQPLQGEWTEQEYLRLTDSCRLPVEFTDGVIDVLPMPTDKHNAIMEYLYRLLYHYVTSIGGTVRTSGIRLQIRADKFREPDLSLLLDAKDERRQNRYWTGADLVVEVVSEDKPARDLIEKRLDYAEANISEYWIVNPQAQTITVLKLAGHGYEEHGSFRRGDEATSAILDKFHLSVTNVFDAD